MYLAREASLAASGAILNVDPVAALDVLQSCLQVQVTYGAILISFSGTSSALFYPHVIYVDIYSRASLGF